jgi:hypothetical protein
MKRQYGGEMSKTAFKGGQKNFPVLKVPKQCRVLLLVVVCLRECKALGNEKR